MIADPHALQGLINQLQGLKIGALPPMQPPEPPLPPAGGGGTPRGMDERVARLEADMGHMKAAITEIRGDLKGAVVDIATIKERLSHVPTIAMMWSAAIAIVVALAGVIALAIRFVPRAA